MRVHEVWVKGRSRIRAGENARFAPDKEDKEDKGSKGLPHHA